jgi:SAM-dependent methyltransferase
MNRVTALVRGARRHAARGRDAAHRVLAAVGIRQNEARIAADSQSYWADPDSARWTSGSHWCDAPVFAGRDVWSEIGARHLEMFERGARMVEFKQPWTRVLEWGCGGGANAVHFAPRADEFVGVDIAPATLAECGRQVATACETPFRSVVVEVAEPERVVGELAGTVDVFLCFYVFELIPTPEYGERLLRIAHDVLRPGGLALIQVKYGDGTFWTRPRRRSYRTSLMHMTTYPIEGFWKLAESCGLTPESIELVPQNELDKRYAYFLLSKPDKGP